MTLDDLTGALDLPEATRVNQRVPKKLLAEQEVATAADRRLIQDGVDEIVWLAALKPHLIGVPACADHVRQYLELAVLCLTLKPGTPPRRLVELLHRAVPYPVLLFTLSDAGIGLSLAHLRRSQNDADKTVLDGELLTLTLSSTDTDQSTTLADFCAAFALARQPQADLHALYQGWMDTVTALDIAGETGRFQPSGSREQAVVRHAALQRCRALDVQIAQLVRQLAKERQMARQVALNQTLQRLRRERQALRSHALMPILAT